MSEGEKEVVRGRERESWLLSFGSMGFFVP